MVRLLGNNLIKTKKIYIALTTIYGIGVSTALKILSDAAINPDLRVNDLQDLDISKLRNILETGPYILQGSLRKQVYQHIKRLVDIDCYRGRRHAKGLPCRGQRTRTNAKTSRKKKESKN